MRGGVEPQVVEAALDEPPADRRGDDVARREVGERVLVGHERDAVLVAQDRALAAQRLGEQRPRHRRVVQRGRVELHELEVGDRDAGAQRHRDAVAGRQRRVGGDREALPGAAGRERRCGGPAASLGAVGRRRAMHAGDAAVLDEQVGGEPALADVGARAPAPRRPAPARSRRRWRRRRRARPGRRSGRPRACGRSSPSPSTWSKCAPSAMSSRTRSGPSLTSTRTASASQSPPPAASVSEPCSSGESSSSIERGGDAALRVAGGRPAELALGEHGDRQARARGRGPRPRGRRRRCRGRGGRSWVRYDSDTVSPGTAPSYGATSRTECTVGWLCSSTCTTSGS